MKKNEQKFKQVGKDIIGKILNYILKVFLLLISIDILDYYLKNWFISYIIVFGIYFTHKKIIQCLKNFNDKLLILIGKWSMKIKGVEK